MFNSVRGRPILPPGFGEGWGRSVAGLPAVATLVFIVGCISGISIGVPLDTGDPNPSQRTQQGFIEKYAADARQRLEQLRTKPDAGWREETQFFDVRRSRAWIMTRRINHATHHRGQLVVYLRLLGELVPSVYGPTADTNGVAKYKL